MKAIDISGWLKDQQSVVENIILDAATKYVERHKHYPNFGFDFQEAQKEAYNLTNGSDLCYDRVATPLAYSLWYQARRINVFVSHFYEQLVQGCSSSHPIEVFDLGAGTGCVQLSFGLAYVGFVRAGFQPNFIRCINVDLSPFMLEYLRSYLWPAAISYYPELKKLPVDYQVYSWSNKSDIAVLNPWICASYLFDSSDNEDYLKTNFHYLISTFNPEKVMLLTSSQPNKLNLLKGLSDKMAKAGYNLKETSRQNNFFTGNLPAVNEFRQSLIREYSLKASSSSVTWQDRSFTALALDRIQTGFSFAKSSVPQNLDLFNPPLKIRREISLNDEQTIAARFEERPAIITGPAGCGKSIVMTEKIINVLENFMWSKNLTILVTTFNKGLIKQLRTWVTDLLVSKKKHFSNVYYRTYNGTDDGTGEIVITAQFEIKIKFIHFEMLGKYIGNLHFHNYDEHKHNIQIEKLISELRVSKNLNPTDLSDILNAQFIQEEYHRVIYGLGCKVSLGQDAYQTVERKGRGRKPQLQHNSTRREYVWLILSRYLRWMYESSEVGTSFIARRQLFLNGLEQKSIEQKFDYVFVDEFQDCTAADFRIMSLLLKDPNNLTISGDLAQAVHIGQSGAIPRDSEMAKRKFHKLKGSYRLPCRISEAIFPLSQSITANSSDKDATMEITPYKGAPPGARPIIVFGSDNEDLASKIVQIKKSYSLLDLSTITILEKDEKLCKSIRNLDNAVETTTILKLKGLEKEFIVWSLQADILFENEVNEFAYTIMTRTNCMLIIAINESHHKYLLHLLRFIRKDRLILWDSETTKFITESVAMDLKTNVDSQIEEII